MWAGTRESVLPLGVGRTGISRTQYIRVGQRYIRTRTIPYYRQSKLGVEQSKSGYDRPEQGRFNRGEQGRCGYK